MINRIYNQIIHIARTRPCMLMDRFRDITLVITVGCLVEAAILQHKIRLRFSRLSKGLSGFIEIERIVIVHLILLLHGVSDKLVIHHSIALHTCSLERRKVCQRMGGPVLTISLDLVTLLTILISQRVLMTTTGLSCLTIELIFLHQRTVIGS